MNIRSILKKQVQNFYIENEHRLTKPELYNEVIEHFNINRKTASRYYLELYNKIFNEGLNSIPAAQYSDAHVSKILMREGDNLIVALNVDHEIKTLEDLLEACEVDQTKWEVLSWQCGKHDLGIKNSKKEIEKTQLFSVKAKFKQKTVDNNISLQKDLLLRELFDKSPKHEKASYTVEKVLETENLYELALFDVHFGKLAHKEESGEDYDLKIAVSRYRNAINSLLSRVNINSIDRILLPIGNDLINVDSSANMTTAGTPQDNDSRFYKIVRTVKNLLIETIDELLKIAPVDVVVCVGNHDQQTSFMIGEMLEAYYHNNEYVNIDNKAALRKYYKYGEVSILFTHGDKEKHTNLGMIFAAENPQLWASTTQRYVQIGHFHKNKKIEYIANDEYQGFQIQTIPSLSNADAWHAGKGYNSLKQAKGFLYNKVEGKIGEFTYTVKD